MADWAAENICQKDQFGRPSPEHSVHFGPRRQECFDLGARYGQDDCSQGWPALSLEGYAARRQVWGAAVFVLVLGPLGGLQKQHVTLPRISM